MEHMDQKRIPRHIAIIMDGNGRWARQRGLDRICGHIQGVESVRKVVRAAADCGVEYLTIYAFSTENWGRPSREVEALMKLLCESTEKETPALLSEGIRMRFNRRHGGSLCRCAGGYPPQRKNHGGQYGTDVADRGQLQFALGDHPYGSAGGCRSGTGRP